MSITKADEIKHLTNAQVEELYDKYISGEKNQTLIAEYKLTCSPQNLYKVFPPIIQNDVICPTCSIPMYAPRPSKSYRTYPYFCSKCQHIRPFYEESYNTCTCAACTQERLDKKAREEQETINLIKQQFALEQYSSYPYSSLNFMDKCFLLALCQMQEEICNNVLLPLSSYYIRFSPTDKMDDEIILSLHKKQILLVNPDSRLGAFFGSSERMGFYHTAVSWVINIADSKGNRLTLEELYEALLADLSATPSEVYKNDIKHFIFELAVTELERYITEQLEALRLPPPPEKTKLSLKEILNHFSVAQGCYFCFLSARKAQDFYLTGAKNKNHAVNTIPNRLLNLKSRALMEEWDVKNYKWNRDTSYCQLTNTFYEVLCPDWPEVGFSECPMSLWENVISQRFSSSQSDENIFSCPECGSVDHSFSGNMKLLLMTCNGCGFEAGFTEQGAEATESDMIEKIEHST
ncbi:hypothetical protein [Pseudoalteromonas luteoviolacea]|uniref:hypothetical protein n=1 Tax=Pseudoalteromonas luteoviolacea TaxID=43657 RepID=UPI001B3913FC|nr:hypothetical protein [Pseudoalteromonas luteoviolacea]MBQ4839816.1 hypothetical protein [Pseudoalteromonas luteoviolacea]